MKEQFPQSFVDIVQSLFSSVFTMELNIFEMNQVRKLIKSILLLAYLFHSSFQMEIPVDKRKIWQFL